MATKTNTAHDKATNTAHDKALVFRQALDKHLGVLGTIKGKLSGIDEDLMTAAELAIWQLVKDY